jgi:hypothetical protein
MFLKLDHFPSSGNRRETPVLLGPLERANLNHWTNEPEDGNRSVFRNVLSIYLEFPTMLKSINVVIQSNILIWTIYVSVDITWNALEPEYMH